MCDILDIPGYFVTMDIDKAFNYLDHDFLLSVVKKFGLAENFIYRTKIILNNQQPCVVNGGIYNSTF